MRKIKDQLRIICKHATICFEHVKNCFPEENSMHTRLLILSKLVQYSNEKLSENKKTTEADLIDNRESALRI